MIRPHIVEGVEISTIGPAPCDLHALSPEEAVARLADELVAGRDAAVCDGCCERMNAVVVRMLAGGAS